MSNIEELKAKWENRCDYIKKQKNVNTDGIFNFFAFEFNDQLAAKDKKIEELLEQINAESTVSNGYKNQIEQMEKRLETAENILKRFQMLCVHFDDSKTADEINTFLTNKNK